VLFTEDKEVYWISLLFDIEYPWLTHTSSARTMFKTSILYKIPLC